MDKPVAAAPTGAKEKVEKQARQLAYDTRYKVRQSMKAKSRWSHRSCCDEKGIYITTRKVTFCTCNQSKSKANAYG
ncbi:MAG: hypothetical protein CM15mV9_0250 [uncultured marine virus]|nr:MAG: hypothetical protein CM15mV9_0250 [uncultured marine virus]